jgi:hypothetical protein
MSAFEVLTVWRPPATGGVISRTGQDPFGQFIHAP